MPRFSGMRADWQFDDWTHNQTDIIVDEAIKAGYTTAPAIAAANGMSLRYAYEIQARRKPRRKLRERILQRHAAGESPPPSPPR